MRLRVLAALLVALLAASSHVSAEETKVGPDRLGWWRIGPLALVTGAGVDDGQLLVDGFGPEESSWQAVSAVSFPFEVSPEATVSPMSLSIPVVSAPLPDSQVHLCTVTSDFGAVANGAAQDVPPHDCTTAITGTIDDDGILRASGIESSMVGSHVRLLLVPAQPGRIVLDGAGASLHAEQPSQATPAPPASAPHRPPDQAPVPDVNVEAPAPPSFAPTPSASSAFEDQVAGTPTESQAPALSPSTQPTIQSAFSPPAGDAAARRVTALIVALVLGLFTVFNRGGTARLRPAKVSWLRAESPTATS